MNLKRILSSALVVIMMFSAIAVLIPVEAKAAHHSSVSETRLSTDEVKVIVNNYQKAEYASAEEMFQTELALGYLDSATDGVFTIYVNRYTGVMYYKNELSGEIIMSNPNNYTGIYLYDNCSQLRVRFSSVSDSSKIYTYLSYEWSTNKNPITVSEIENGLRLRYSFGCLENRALLPVEAHRRSVRADRPQDG